LNNEHYLIHKDDYVKHIDEKVMLYSFVKQLCHHVTKMKMTPENGHICKMAKHFYIEADKMFDSWGIPGSYLVFGDESDLAELMENELIAPEDAGYYPIDDDEDDACYFECRCGCCCGCCLDEDGDDEDDEDDEDIEEFAEAMAELVAHIHSIFGNDVTFHIVID